MVQVLNVSNYIHSKPHFTYLPWSATYKILCNWPIHSA